MRNPMITFAATLSVALPAAWQPLGAGAPEDGPATRPPLQTLVTKQGVVTMSVDRAQIQPGDDVTVTLVASADTPRDIDVEVWVSQYDIAFMDRNDSEPIVADGGRITVPAAPGGGEPRRMTFRLGKALDDETLLSRGGSLARYEIALFRARTKPLFYKGEAAWGFDSSALAEVRSVAPSPIEIEIEPVKRLRANRDHIVKVRVRNTSSHTIKDTNVQLTGDAVEAIQSDGEDSSTFVIEKLKPGAERVLRYRVTTGEAVTTTNFTAYVMTDRGANAAAVLTVKPSGEVLQALSDSSAFFVLLDRGGVQGG